jgi:hypothetical protein
MSLHRRTFLNTAAVAAATSIPGCMAVAPAAASICKAAPYLPAPSPEPDPVFAAIARWRPLQTQLDEALSEGDFEQNFMPAQRALSAIYETEPTTPEGVLAILVVMREQESVHLDIEKFENCCDDLHRGLWRVMRAAERLLTGSVQS